MSPLTDVLPSVVTDHTLQKPFKLSAFSLYFCQRFFYKNVGKIKNLENVKNVEITKTYKTFLHPWLQRHITMLELGLLTMGAWAWMRLKRQLLLT